MKKKYICSTYLIFMGYQFIEEKVPAHELGVIGGSVEETLYIILKIWIFLSCHSVVTFLRTVLLNFWVTGGQLSLCFAGYFLTKTETKAWVRNFKVCCMLRIIHKHFLHRATFTYFVTELKIRPNLSLCLCLCLFVS